MTHPVSSPISVELALDQAMLDTVLEPYKPNCRYLKSATVEHGSSDPLIKACGIFSIPESCYIVNTGHFNAVEFNICYNQLTYCLLAKCIECELVDSLAGWDLAEFSRRQLPDFLITRFFSSFRKPLKADEFVGRVQLLKVSTRREAIFMKTTCQFDDRCGGRADGGATFAIVNNA